MDDAEHTSGQIPRLEIGLVVERAREIVQRVADDLPTHQGLKRATQGVLSAACAAEQAARRLRRPLSPHRVPVIFLVVSLGLFAFWIYLHFFRVSELTVAVSRQDAVQLRIDVQHRLRIRPVETEGSRDSIQKLESGVAHLAFVQGGVEIPEGLPQIEIGMREWVLFYTRSRITNRSQIHKILTSNRGQGSHSLAQTFARIWGIAEQVEYLHDWRTFAADLEYQIADDVDAVFVVKDPLNTTVVTTPKRLRDAGFRLAPPDIGLMSLQLPYLQEAEIRANYLDPVAQLPTDTVATYQVATYLVGRNDLTARQLAAAIDLLTPTNRFAADGFAPDLSTASEVVQGVEATLGIVVYIGLAFLALLGLDIITYRRRFNELNMLVSLIVMHQSEKDVIGCNADQRAHNVTYLRVCSDLLGLITVITGYYAQENTALTYNRLFEVIHDRCNGLKLNIQLKILHALIEFPEPPGRCE